MEDGAFLGRVIAEVVRGVLTLPEAITLYEKHRMPRAWIKQQSSFLIGEIYMVPDGPFASARDKSSEASTRSPPFQSRQSRPVVDKMSLNKITGPDANQRSWNLWGAPETIASIYGYDAESDADYAVLKYLMDQGPVDANTKMSQRLTEKWAGWFLSKEQVEEMKTGWKSKL